MVKVAVLGASGRVGSLIVDRASKKGFDVTAIVRNAEKAPEGFPNLVKDVYKLTTNDISEFDVLVSALGFWGNEVEEFTPSMHHLLSILKGTTTKFMVVGGAGSLYVDKGHTKQLRQTLDFPKDFYALGTEMAKSLDILKQSSGINWTYISPAAEFSPDLPVKGEYVIEGEEFTTNYKGESKISYEDFAKAFVDQLNNNQYSQKRISVRW